jgi:glycosyl transferase family 87
LTIRTALLGARSVSLIERYARLVVVAILVGIAVDEIYFAIRDWPLHDMDIYLQAASRLRTGESLYPTGGPFYLSFWYSPWFAVAWIPMTFAPRIVVAVAWSAVLLVATAVVTLLVWRTGRSGPVLALLVGPALFAVSAGGNIQSVMVLSLLWGLHRRSGPVWVGIAASMKYTPLLLALAYVARREWAKAVVAGGIAAALIVPGFALGLLGAAAHSQAAQSLLSASVPAYIAVVLAFCVLTIRGPRRYSALTAAAAAVLALPRLFLYDVTLVATGSSEAPRRSANREAV